MRMNKNITKEAVLEFYKEDINYYNRKKQLCEKYNCKTRLTGLSEIVSEKRN